jgi:hypothetical protein
MADYNQYRNHKREGSKRITIEGSGARQHLVMSLRQRKEEILANDLSWAARKLLLSQVVGFLNLLFNVVFATCYSASGSARLSPRAVKPSPRPGLFMDSLHPSWILRVRSF